MFIVGILTVSEFHYNCYFITLLRILYSDSLLSHFVEKMDAKSNPSEIRNRAVGILLAGITQKKVSNDVGVSIRTIKRWRLKYRKGESLEHRPGARPPKKLSRTSKITIAKSLGKDGSRHALWHTGLLLWVIQCLRIQFTGIYKSP